MDRALDGPPSADLSVTSGGDVVTSRRRLPALEAFLRGNETIMGAAKTYLGDDAALDGYKVTRLSTKTEADEASYIAGMWHHDRAGARLKLFIFLHDVCLLYTSDAADE